MDIVKGIASIRQTPKRLFEKRLGLCAITVRPYGTKGEPFPSHFVDARKMAFYVLQGRYVQQGSAKHRSCPLVAFRPRHDVQLGTICVGPEDCVAAFDLALGPKYKDRPNFFPPQRQRRTARMAINMWWSLMHTDDAGIQMAITMPSFYFGFPQHQPPKFEDSYRLRHAAALLLSQGEISDPRLPDLSTAVCWDNVESALRSHVAGLYDLDSVRQMAFEELKQLVLSKTWSRYQVEHEGMIFMPQIFFARHGVDYQRHPHSGLPSPAEGGPQEGWVHRDGRWIPLAQVPTAMFVDLTHWLGVESRNPAFSALRKQGLPIVGETYAEFAEHLRNQEHHYSWASSNWNRSMC